MGRAASVPTGTTGILVENAELGRNNWRGAQVGFTGWAAGIKFGMTSQRDDQGLERPPQLQPRPVVRRRQQKCDGHRARQRRQPRPGLFLEKNPGPIVVDGARVCNNGASGISYGRSDRATVRNSQVFTNAGWQHLHTGDATPATMADGTVVRGNYFSLQNTVTVGDDWAQKDSMDKGWLFWHTTADTGFWSSASLQRQHVVPHAADQPVPDHLRLERLVHLSDVRQQGPGVLRPLGEPGDAQLPGSATGQAGGLRAGLVSRRGAG